MNDAFGKALQTVLDKWIETHSSTDFSMYVLSNLISAALAQSGPQAEKCPYCGVAYVEGARHFSGCVLHPGEPALAPQEAGGEIGGKGKGAGDSTSYRVHPDYYKYLEARDKWIEEYAKPALESAFRNEAAAFTKVGYALAAQPAMPTREP